MWHVRSGSTAECGTQSPHGGIGSMNRIKRVRMVFRTCEDIIIRRSGTYFMQFKFWLETKKMPEPWEMTREEAMAHREYLFQRHHELCQKYGGYPTCSNV